MQLRYLNEVPQDLFTDLHQIGSGSFSTIFSATHVKTKTQVALKITLKNNNEGEMRALSNEISANKTIDHPFICKFFTNLETNHLIIIVMELIEGLTALEYVNKDNGLPLVEAKNIFTQLLIAVEYLHEVHHISHRDLKLENVMIDKYSHIRLIDFGFCSVKSLMTTCCGSIPYCSPEILTGQPYNNSTDIWSMGVILYSLVNGNLPFYHRNFKTLISIICQGEVNFPDTFDSNLRDLLTKMLAKDPQQRISIEEIKKHPFLSREKLLKINYKHLLSSKPRTITNQTSLITTPDIAFCSADSDQFFITKNTNLHLKPFLKVRSRRQSYIPPKLLISFHQTLDASLSDEIKDLDSLDEAILERKDYATKLNNLIKTALIAFSYPQKASINKHMSAQHVTYFKDMYFPSLKRNPHHIKFKGNPLALCPNPPSNQILL